VTVDFNEIQLVILGKFFTGKNSDQY